MSKDITNSSGSSNIRGISASQLSKLVWYSLDLKQNLLVFGNPGFGKTEIVIKTVEEYIENVDKKEGRKIKYSVLNLSSMESIDLNGLPLIINTENNHSNQLKNDNKNSSVVSVSGNNNFFSCSNYVEGNNLNNLKVHFIQPEFLHSDGVDELVLILDEINRASVDVINAILPAFNSKGKRIGVHKLPDKTTIFCMANYEGIGIYDLPEALYSRSLIFYLNPSFSEVLKYFSSKYNSKNTFLNFLKSSYANIPEDFGNSSDINYNKGIEINARNLEKVLDIFEKSEEIDLPENIRNLMIAGAVGNDMLYKFIEYEKQMKKINPKNFFTEEKDEFFRELIENFEPSKNAFLIDIVPVVISMIDEKNIKTFLDTCFLLYDSGYKESAVSFLRKLGETERKRVILEKVLDKDTKYLERIYTVFEYNKV
ncbi:MAG: hypothetical protein ABIM60_05215 [candidate division WOR-3 bacterium]